MKEMKKEDEMPVIDTQQAEKNTIAPYEAQHQAEIYRMSTNAAAICKEVVLASAQDIAGKKYVRVEGWQAIAIAHGCTASSGEVEKTDTGVKAIGKVIRMSDGMVLSQAEGFVGDDEAMWASRPEYARRAMAQTRAISRACRSAFAHVVVMMNAGLSTTPAEEVPLDGFDTKPITPLTPPQEKKTEAVEKTIEGIITKVEETSGEKKDKTIWTRFAIHIDNLILSTFSKTVGEKARIAQENGTPVRLSYIQEGKFHTCTGITEIGVTPK
jgi:hypothetical protein